MLKNIRQMVGAGLVACGSTVYAASTWIGGSSGVWNSESSWEGGKPVAGDTVEVPDNADLPIGDAEAEAAGALAEIKLLGSGSRVVFGLDDASCSLAGKITGKGTIVKNGTNTLFLTSTGNSDYLVTGGVRLNGGIIQCPTTFPKTYSSETMSFGPLYVAEGAEFRPCSLYRITEVSALSGKGKVYNYRSGSNDGWPFRVASSTYSAFEGTIGGYLFLQANAPIDFLNEASTYIGSFYVYNSKADVGVVRFGKGTENSSIGKCIWNGVRRAVKYLASGRIRYLGDGETTDRDFTVSAKAACELDAGSSALVCSGKFSMTAAGNSVFTFSGSNTVESVLSGAWDDGTGSTYISKAGSGVWRFVGTDSRRNTGVVAVEDGILRIDSLAETNVPCSLGLSTRLAQKYAGNRDETRTADYAVLLGSAAAEGVLEYDGSNFWESAIGTATRPIAVTGKGGRIVVSGPDRRIGFKGAFAADSAGSTLTLDGNGATNCFYDICDRHGRLSVVKEGNGAWILGGDLKFSGDLKVKGGELVVSSLMGRSYTWYRYTVCQSYYGAIHDPATAPVANNSSVRMREFAIFDVDGNRLNGGYSGVSQLTVPSEKEVSGWALNAVVPAATCTGLTDGSIADTVNVNVVIDSVRTPPTWNDPRTWIPFVFRMPAGTVSADSYDIVSSENNTHVWEPSGFKMEASADGVFWDLVSNVESNDVTYAAKKWISNGGAFSASAKHVGFKFGLDNGKSLIKGDVEQLVGTTVSVSPGAVLRAEGDVSIGALEIDASGAGGIDGFQIADEGTVNITGLKKLDTTVKLPLAFANATGTENFAAGWAVKVNGTPKDGAKLSFKDGKLSVIPSGMLIILR